MKKQRNGMHAHILWLVHHISLETERNEVCD